jgi:mevalonate kinase
MLNTPFNQSLGKTILGGEHSVVYGYPAVVAGIDLWIKAVSEDAKVQLSDNTKFQEINVPETFVKNIAEIAEKYLETKLKLPKVKFVGDLLIGRGMGSSAAIAKAWYELLAEVNEIKLSQRDLFDLLIKSEEYAHGKSSGVDAAAVVMGGVLRFQKINDQPSFEQISPKRLQAFNWWLIDSGKPQESTKEMVALVAKHPRKDQLFEQLGEATDELIEWLENEDNESNEDSPGWLLPYHSLLNELGIVSPEATKLINEIEAVGGLAKVTGAGGKTGGSGMILATHQNKALFNKWLSNQKKWWKEIRLGVNSSQ